MKRGFRERGVAGVLKVETPGPKPKIANRDTGASTRQVAPGKTTGAMENIRMRFPLYGGLCTREFRPRTYGHPGRHNRATQSPRRYAARDFVGAPTRRRWVSYAIHSKRLKPQIVS